jgi:SAM-dependent methyltransferase
MKPTTPKSTERFSNRVDNYVKYRPTYPEAVLEILRSDIGLTPSWIIADVGSGTGISAELFLRNGHEVFAVEPNGPMREAAERWQGASEKYHSVVGTAEATTLADGSVDCVVAAQAFHWFDISKARAEFMRILRASRWVVLMWNARRLESTPFLREYEELLLKFGTDYAGVRHNLIDETALKSLFGNDSYLRRTVENHQHLDLDGLRGRLLSSSYVPPAGEPGYDEMLEALARLFEKHQDRGRVTIEYDTQVFAGQLK